MIETFPFSKRNKPFFDVVSVNNPGIINSYHDDDVKRKINRRANVAN
jgi:hypothetical protein